MASVDKILSEEKKKKRLTWSQTKRVGDDTEEVNVEKLDNDGYLVTVSKSGNDEKGNWNREESKMYSKTNPLDPDDDGDNDSLDMDDIASMLVRDNK